MPWFCCHRLDEELVRQGRQHYMNRRDSAVESLTTARGFSSIQAARLQSYSDAPDDAPEGTSATPSVCEGLASALQEEEEAGVGGGVELEKDHGEECQGPSNGGLPNGRALGGAAGASPDPLRSNKGKSSSSTKSASKSSCKNRSQSTVPRIPCGMGVQAARRLSRDSCEKSLNGRPSSGPLLQENHIGHTLEGAGGEARRVSGVRTHPLEEGIVPAPRCSTPARSHPLQEDTEEAPLRPSSSCRGPRGSTSAPRSTSPPVLCHNKIFPQHTGTPPSGGEGQPISWGHSPYPSFLPQPREGAGRGQQEGTSVECEVHPFMQDPPPSPTESTML